MNNTHTKEIELPISKSKVVIKTMLNGNEREQIETSTTKFAKQVQGQTDPVITDIAGAMMAEKHATLDVYIESLDGSTVDCRKRLLKMYEPDIKAVTDEIPELSDSPKKDEAPAKSTSQ